MIRTTLLAVAAFVLVCQGACSGTASTAGPSADQSCSDSAHARCTRYESCSAVWLSEVYADEATCESRVKASCLNSLSAPSNANNPSHNESCATAIPGWSCGDIVIGANAPAACAQVTGPLATGAACYANGQCQTGFCGFANASCGTCMAAPQVGEPCTGPHQCGPGLTCAGDGKCALFALPGTACGTSQPCAPGNQCIGSVCKATATAVAAGQPCGNVNGTVTGCLDGSCENQGGKLVCVARAAPGAACNVTGGPFCQAPALCVGGSCQIPACK
jgi:hypothetical protein